MSSSKSILYPGVAVSIGEGASARDARVYPLGVRHIRKFAGLLDRMLPEVAKVAANFAPGSAAAQDPDGEAAKIETARAFQAILPVVLSEGLELLGECVELPEGVAIDDLAHFDIAKLAKAWIEDSFSEKKRAAWSDALRGVRSGMGA